jgi:hypothetical protein
VTLVLVALLWLPCLALWPGADHGVRNNEANYHVLLTVEALEGTSVDQSHLLPTVTLPGADNTGVPWGATLATNDGQQIYTSFPALGFLAPLVVFEATGVDVSVGDLQALVKVLGLLSWLLLAALLHLVIGNRGSPVLRVGAAVGLTVAAMYSKEGLASGGLVYWGQTLAQPLLIAALIVVLVALRDGRLPAARAWFLGILVFAMCMAEWTGAVFGLGGAALVLWLARRTPAYDDVRRPLVRALGVPVLVAVVVMGVQLTLAVGARAGLRGLSSRAGARSAERDPFLPLQLVRGYLESYGLLLAVALVGLVVLLRVSRPSRRRPLDAGWLLLLLATVPLLENVLVMQHAVEFTYDRYKAVVPLTVVAALAVSRVSWSRSRLVIAAAGTAATVVVGVAQFRADVSDFDDWAAIDRVNHELVSSLSEYVDLGCAVIGATGPVRGYDNLLVGRSVHEWQTAETLLEQSAPPRGCSYVLLRTDQPYTDMSRLTGALVLRPSDGAVVAELSAP